MHNEHLMMDLAAAANFQHPGPRRRRFCVIGSLGLLLHLVRVLQHPQQFLHLRKVSLVRHLDGPLND